MSSYWAAYHGQGLVLTEEEFDNFLETYRSKNTSIVIDQIAAYEDGSIEIRDVDFENPEGQVFHIFCAGDDCCEGFRLTPYRINGKPNEKWEKNGDIPGNNVYVLECDRAIDGMGCFEKKAYDSYEHFVQEFKVKMRAYLPDDFDWDNHIGIFSYACFA